MRSLTQIKSTAIQQAFDRAKAILGSWREILGDAAHAGLERETLEEAALAPVGRRMADRRPDREEPEAA